MSAWSATDLERIGAVDEVTVASHRPDGTVRPAVTIWGVRLGESVYIRSAHGPDNGWFRRARTSGTGQFTAEGVSWPVLFEECDEKDSGLHARLDAAYHAKYDRYGARIVGAVVGPVPARATLRVLPRD